MTDEIFINAVPLFRGTDEDGDHLTIRRGAASLVSQYTSYKKKPDRCRNNKLYLTTYIIF
jgi:hypothetical protein